MAAKNVFTWVFIASVLAGGCEMFLPDEGGQGQACIENSSGDMVCRDGLICCGSTCLPSCLDAGLDGADAGLDGADAGDAGTDSGSDSPADQGGDTGDGDSSGDDGGADTGPAGSCDEDSDCDDLNTKTLGICESGLCHFYPLDAYTEMCTDGIDNDGDGFVDFADTDCGGCGDNLPCSDVDEDGYHSYNSGGGDCNDSDVEVNPGVVESGSLCNGNVDNDCDGKTDENDPSCEVALEYPGGYNAWRWEHPLPQGNDLDDVWVINGRDAWAVGSGGTILHWDGDNWHWVAPPADLENAELVRVWAYPGKDWDSDLVWIVGGKDFQVYRLDSDTWHAESDLSGIAIYGIWGIHPDQLHAVGQSAWLIRKPDGNWLDTEIAGDNIYLYQVHGPDLNTTWAAGVDNTLGTVVATRVLNASGESHAVNVLTADPAILPTAIWAARDGTVWLAGFDSNIGRIFKKEADSSVFTKIFENSLGPVFDLFGLEKGGVTYIWEVENDVSSNSIHSLNVGDGTWTMEIDGTNVQALSGAHPNDVWAVGKGGLMLHRDKSGSAAWQFYSQRKTSADLMAVETLGNDVFAAGTQGETMKRTDGVWERLQNPAARDVLDMTVFFGDEPIILATCSDRFLNSFNGSSWINGDQGVMGQVESVSCDDAFCTLVNSGGKIYTCESYCDTSASWSDTQNDVLVNNKPVELYTTYTNASLNKYLAAGSSGAIAWVNNGTLLVSKNIDQSITFRDSFGVGPEVLVVGDAGSAYYCKINGAQDCTALAVPDGAPDLFSVGGKDGSMFAGGKDGALYHADMSVQTLTEDNSTSAQDIYDIGYDQTSNLIFLVGRNAAILSKSP